MFSRGGNLPAGRQVLEPQGFKAQPPLGDASSEIPAQASVLYCPGGGMVYAKDLKSFVRKDLWVRLPLRAP